MQTFRTIMWVMLAVLVVIFAMNNWDPVTVRIWPGMVWSPPLSFLIIIAFLLGSLPLWLTHRVSKWQMARRVDTAERELEIYRTAQTTSSPESSDTPSQPASGALAEPADDTLSTPAPSETKPGA